eukprot:13655406-Ditylum_brightwellii.AAC.1
MKGPFPLCDADKSKAGLIPGEGALVGFSDSVHGALEAMAPRPLSFFVFSGKTTQAYPSSLSINWVPVLV